MDGAFDSLSTGQFQILVETAIEDDCKNRLQD